MEKIKPRRRTRREKPCFPKLRSQYGAQQSFRFSLVAWFHFGFYALTVLIIAALAVASILLAKHLKVDVNKPFDAVYDYEEYVTDYESQTNASENSGVANASPRRVIGGDIVVFASAQTCEHEWITIGDPVVISEGNCDKDNLSDRVLEITEECSACGAKRTVYEVTAVEHNVTTYTEVGHTDATCTASGYYYKVGTCTRCGDEISRIFTPDATKPAKGHSKTFNEVELGGVPAIDCITPGYRVFEEHCKVCDALVNTKTEIVTTGHTHTDPFVINIETATCTNAGKYEVIVYCKECPPTADGDFVYSRETVIVPANGHNAPYCHSATCIDCGLDLSTLNKEDPYYKEISDHNFARHNVTIVNPTCTTDGYVDYYAKKCTKCDYINPGDNMEREVKPATGHTYTNYCDNSCNVCKEIRTINPASHVYSNTCDSTCNNSGCTYTRPNSELTHDFGPGCLPNCAVCEKVNPAPMPHTTSGYPSCAADLTCTKCSTVVVPAWDHTRRICSDDVCSVCGQSCASLPHVDTNEDYYCDYFCCDEEGILISLRKVNVLKLILFIALMITALGCVAGIIYFLYQTIDLIVKCFRIPSMRLEFYDEVMVWKFGVFTKNHVEKRFVGVYDTLVMPRNKYHYKDSRESRKPAKYGTVLVKVPGGGYEWNLKFFGVKQYAQLQNYLESRKITERFERPRSNFHDDSI